MLVHGQIWVLRIISCTMVKRSTLYQQRLMRNRCVKFVSTSEAVHVVVSVRDESEQPTATDRGTELLTTRGGRCDAATVGLSAAVASHARGERVERVAHSTHASTVSTSEVVRGGVGT